MAIQKFANKIKNLFCSAQLRKKKPKGDFLNGIKAAVRAFANTCPHMSRVLAKWSISI